MSELGRGRANQFEKPQQPPRRPLPAFQEGEVPQNFLKKPVNINDEIQSLVQGLWADQNFQLYLAAVDDTEAVTGSLALDNGKAAEIILEQADKLQNLYVKDLRLATVVRHMNVVLKRHKLDRKTRKNTVGGVVVSDNESDSDE